MAWRGKNTFTILSSDDTFKLFSAGAIPSQHILQKKAKQSLFLCGVYCYNEDACMSFAYNKLTQECSLSNIDFFRESIQVESSTGTHVYSLEFPSN